MENLGFRGQSRERNLLVHKDALGYGLTLSGDKPVFVQTVRQGGAAFRAGIREQDVIIRVNGVRVTESNHNEVVKQIQAHDSVALTVIGAATTPGGASDGRSPTRSSTLNNNDFDSPTSGPNSFQESPTSTPRSPNNNSGLGILQSNSMLSLLTGGSGAGHNGSVSGTIRGGSRDRITAPIPANDDAMRLVAEERQHTIRLMAEQERRNVEKLRQSLASRFSVKIQAQLDVAVKRLNKLDEELQLMHGGGGGSVKPPSRPNSFLSDSREGSVAPATPSPPPRPQDTLPPPLPKRNSRSSMTNLIPPEIPPTGPPPLPPPRASPGGVTGPSPPPKRGSSQENLSGSILKKSPKRSNTTGSTNRQTPRGGVSSQNLSPSGQSATPPPPGSGGINHSRTKSSPSSLVDFSAAIPENPVASSLPSAAATLSPAPKSAATGFSKRPGRVSPRYETPPGTPPPPYYGEEEGTSPTPTVKAEGPGFEMVPEGLVTWPQLVGASADFAGADTIMTFDDDDDDLSEADEAILTSGVSGLSAGTTARPPGSPEDTAESPFDNLRNLFAHNAHLSVFVNYVMSNDLDPSAMFFYLITQPEHYRLGSLKDMQKWAYEIHSTFLMPDAPLRVPNLSDTAVNEIDKALIEDFEKEDVHQKLFWKARATARKALKEHLADFREKRAAGLGSIYGPPDAELKACIDSRTKELQVIDDLLVPLLDTLSRDLESTSERALTLASSLATLISKNFDAKSPRNSHLIEKCPLFTSREKKSKLFGRNKKLQIQGHNFELKQYTSVTLCNFTQKMIWGIGPQGYKCANCDYNVNKKFVSQVDETCVGPTSASASSNKNRSRNTKSGVFSKMVSDLGLPTRKASTPGKEASFQIYRPEDLNDSNEGESRHAVRQVAGSMDTPDHAANTSIPTSSSDPVFDSPKSMASSPVKSGSPGGSRLSELMGLTPSGSDPKLQSAEDERRNEAASFSSASPKTGNKVDRSQSLKDQKGRGNTERRERRKNSDPSLPRGSAVPSDVEVEIPIQQQPTSSTGSSTSDLTASRSSVDSPAGSQQEITATSSLTSAIPSASATTSSASAAHRPASSSSTATSADPHHHYHTIDGDDGDALSAGEDVLADSDFDTEPDPKDWRLSLTHDELAKLSKKETQRQDVINELFHTEKSHVRNLKVLDRFFHQPLSAAVKQPLTPAHNSSSSSSSAGASGQQALPKEFVENLFPNLNDVIAWHDKANQRMKETVKKSGFPIGNIGSILSDMFLGPNGERLIEVGATFTQNQKFSIEDLNQRRRRDHKLDQFLSEQERRPECRRLQVHALLPAEHQRLVKYPLLLGQLAKQSEEAGEAELQTILTCVEKTREILESIDRRVAKAQNRHRLSEIQTNLDTSGLDKVPESPITQEYRKVDLTRSTLIYDGALTMKLGDTRRYKTVDLHVLLLMDCIMLLQKQDDKFLLKFHTSSVVTGGQGHSGKYSPVIKFSSMLVRANASDKRAFYIINTVSNGTGPQIYELIASSQADRAQWFRHITEASNAYKSRENNRRNQPGGNRAGDLVSAHNGFSLDAGGGKAGAGSSSDLLGVSLDGSGGKPAGRSQSFHESSKREGDAAGAGEDTLSKKTDGDGPSNSSNTGPRKRLQRVEILKIAEPCPLIDPSQVVVTQGEVLVAEPVLTLQEKLRRKDMEVTRALEEKQRLIAEILNVPYEDFDHISDMAAESSANRDAREVLLAALEQAKCLSNLVNETLSLTEEERVLASSSSSSSYLQRAASSAASATAVIGDESANGEGPSTPKLNASTSSASGIDMSTRELPPIPDSIASEPSSSATTKAAASASEVSTTPTAAKPGSRIPNLSGSGLGVISSTDKLVSISNNMNSHLTTLLGIMQERDEEREKLRKELQRSQEQVHAFLSQSGSMRTNSTSVTSPGSRPASFVSAGDEAGEASGPEASSVKGASAKTVNSADEEADKVMPASLVTVAAGQSLDLESQTETSPEKETEEESKDSISPNGDSDRTITEDPTPSLILTSDPPATTGGEVGALGAASDVSISESNA